MRKSFVTMGLVVALSMVTSMTALAGWEQTGTTWKYQNADKTYMTNTWNWIDGNGDNVAECYYFGSDGIMLASATVEGYTVNENGAWTVNGVVQTKVVGNNTSQSEPTNNTPTPESQPRSDNKYVDDEGLIDYEKIINDAMAGVPEAQEKMKEVVGPGAEGNHNWN